MKNFVKLAAITVVALLVQVGNPGKADALTITKTSSSINTSYTAVTVACPDGYTKNSSGVCAPISGTGSSTGIPCSLEITWGYNFGTGQWDLMMNVGDFSSGLENPTVYTYLLHSISAPPPSDGQTAPTQDQVGSFVPPTLEFIGFISPPPDLTITFPTFTFPYLFLITNLGNGAAAVPEPSTVVLMGAGLVGLLGFGYKRRMKTKAE